MSARNSSFNKNKNPFDDDDMTSAFMNSSSASYLAADKVLSGSYEDEPVISEAERRRNELLQELQQTEQRTLDSSKRSLGMLIESEKVGIDTAEDLSRQREQLENTEKRLQDMNSTLKDTQQNINGIKSVFSSMKQWWRAPKKKTGEKTGENKDGANADAMTDKSEVILTKNLSGAVTNSQNSIEKTERSTPHPALQLRGIEEDPRAIQNSDFRARSQAVNDKLDDDLGQMSSGLSRLKMLATGLGSEIQEQNALVGRIQTEADKADLTIDSQNKQMNKILKK